jgi:hypothetical protein
METSIYHFHFYYYLRSIFVFKKKIEKASKREAAMRSIFIFLASVNMVLAINRAGSHIVIRFKGEYRASNNLRDNSEIAMNFSKRTNIVQAANPGLILVWLFALFL